MGRHHQEDTSEECLQQPRGTKKCVETEDCEDDPSKYNHHVTCSDGNEVCYQSYCWAKYASAKVPNKKRGGIPAIFVKGKFPTWARRQACNKGFGYRGKDGKPDLVVWFNQNRKGGECILKASNIDMTAHDSNWEQLTSTGFGYKSWNGQISGGIWESTCKDTRSFRDCTNLFYEAKRAKDRDECSKKLGISG